MSYPSNQVLLEKLKLSTSLEPRDLIALEAAFSDDPALLHEVLLELLSSNFEQSVDANVINAIISERYKFLQENSAKLQARITYAESMEEIERKQKASIHDELLNIICDIFLSILVAVILGCIVIYFNKTDNYPFYIILIIVTIAVLTSFRVKAQVNKMLKVRKVQIPTEEEITRIILDENLQKEIKDEIE